MIGAPLAMNYYKHDDPAQPPRNRWKSHAHLLYGNWIAEMYMTTPYDVAKIGEATKDRRG